MVLRSEIRNFNGRPRYCWSDYSIEPSGKIIRWTRFVNAEIVNDKPPELKEEKPEEKQIKEIEKPIENHDDVEKTSIDKDETKDEIQTNNETENEVNEMSELNEENLMRKMEERLESKAKQQRLEQELAETRAQVNEFGEVVGKAMDSRMNGISSKLDNIASASSMAVEVKRRDELEAATATAKMRQLTHKAVEEVEIDCPTCAKSGHKHALKLTDKGTVKCSGEHCNKEYSMIDKKAMDNIGEADGWCSDCHTPVFKDSDSCPTCHGHKGMPFKR